jgi:hypothetical protein
MNVSPHFTLEELVVTDTGLPNDPNEDQKNRLVHLANYILERVRVSVGCPIHINSAFRSTEVNEAVHGSKTSAHLRGDAADWVPMSNAIDLTDTYELICDDPGLDYDQLIWEAHTTPRGGFTRWIHIGAPAAGMTARRQKLIFTPKTNGKYLPFDRQYTV